MIGEENSRKRIGKRVRELRLKKGFSKQKLASLTGISPASVARMEAGRHSVGVDTLARISHVLDCSLEIVENGKLRIEYKKWETERERILVQLKNIRIEKNIRQHKFADLLGIACCNMSLIESAKRSTGTELISRIAGLLGCSLEILTAGERNTMKVKQIKDSMELSQDEIDFLAKNYAKPLSFLTDKLGRSEMDVKNKIQKLKLKWKYERAEISTGRHEKD
jgi:transcriptional regulator with XRE-family HTH domain